MGHLFEDMGKRISRDKMSKPPLNAEVQHQVWIVQDLADKAFALIRSPELNHDGADAGNIEHDFIGVLGFQPKKLIGENIDVR